MVIVHFDNTVNQPTHWMHFGFYALFIKKTTGCRINYGKTNYDFDDETVVSFAPGQTVGIHPLEDGQTPEAVGLLFHPDFLNRTPQTLASFLNITSTYLSRLRKNNRK